MPHMKTSGNSRPLAECMVISCTQSSQASAWPSPASRAACDRNASSLGHLFGRIRFEAAGGADQLLEVLDAGFATLALFFLEMRISPLR